MHVPLLCTVLLSQFPFAQLVAAFAGCALLLERKVNTMISDCICTGNDPRPGIVWTLTQLSLNSITAYLHQSSFLQHFPFAPSQSCHDNGRQLSLARRFFSERVNAASLFTFFTHLPRRFSSPLAKESISLLQLFHIKSSYRKRFLFLTHHKTRRLSFRPPPPLFLKAHHFKFCSGRTRSSSSKQRAADNRSTSPVR